MATGSPSDVAALVLDLASARPATARRPAGWSASTGRPGPARPRWARQLAERHRRAADPRRRPDGGLARSGRGGPPARRPGRGPGRGPARAATSTTTGMRDRYDRTVEVPPAPWLVVEGVGSGAAALAAYITVLVWVEVDDDLRLARGLERDGDEMQAALAAVHARRARAVRPRPHPRARRRRRGRHRPAATRGALSVSPGDPRRRPGSARSSRPPHPVPLPRSARAASRCRAPLGRRVRGR